MTAAGPPEDRGLVLGQRGTTEFLLRTGENTGRVVDVGAETVSTVPNLALELAEGDWGEVTDGDGARAAISLVAQSEARWRETAGDLSGIDFSGGGRKDGEGN